MDNLLVYGKTWETTPGQLLRRVPKAVSAGTVVSKFNNSLSDLDRPFEEKNSVTVRLLSSKDPEGRTVFWHLSAHALGEAAEREYRCRLRHGPSTDQGFFYDIALDHGRAVHEVDWPLLQTRAKRFFKEVQPFERLLA